MGGMLMPVIVIKVTEEMRRIAHRRKKKYELITNGRDYVTPKSNFWAGDDQHQNFISDVGEQCFEILLKDNSIEYEKDVLYTNRGDKFDFKIDGKTIDVKTGHFKNGTFHQLPPDYRFLIYEKQLPKPVDYYVHVQVDPDVGLAYIVGCMTRSQALTYEIVKRATMQGPAAYIPFNDLSPLDDLLDLKEEMPAPEIPVMQRALDEWM
jgi:hypothetical protein